MDIEDAGFKVKPLHANDVEGAVLESAEGLPYYRDHKIRKGSIYAAEVLFTCRRVRERDRWMEMTREWLGNINDGNAVIISFEMTGSGTIRSVIIPVHNGRLSYREYFGLRDRFLLLKASYRDYCSTGIFRKYKQGSQDSEKLKIQIGSLKKENRYLKNINREYIEFISENGGLKKVRAMLKSARELQYAVKWYQETGNKEVVGTILEILKHGEIYAQEHGIQI